MRHSFHFRSAFLPMILLAAPALGLAHEGPPFPIVMDQPLAGYNISVWADPDIGDAQFFVIVEDPAGGRPSTTPEVAIWVEPVDGRLERATYQAEQQPIRNQLEFAAQPYFDQQDQWTVGICVTALDGSAEELTVQVESTPPGYGPVDLAIYLFPFVLLGAFWILAMRRRTQHRRMEQTQQFSVPTDS